MAAWHYFRRGLCVTPPVTPPLEEVKGITHWGKGQKYTCDVCGRHFFEKPDIISLTRPIVCRPCYQGPKAIERSIMDFSSDLVPTRTGKGPVSKSHRRRFKHE